MTKLIHPDGPLGRDHIGPNEASVKFEKQVEDLIRRHRELDAEIQVLQHSPPDRELVKCLKRQKLRLKDRIATLNGPQIGHAPWSLGV